MKSYDSCSQPKQSSSNWMLMCTIFLFFMTLTAFTIMEVNNFYSDELSGVRIILNSFKSSEEKEFSKTSTPNKFVLLNVEKQRDTEELLKTIINEEEFKDLPPEREAREAEEEKTTVTPKNFYYEEQSPVVVYSRSDPDIPLSYRQPVYVPPKQDTNEEKPFNDDDNDDVVESRQNPYYSGSEEQDYYSHQDEQPYYKPSSGQQQQYYGYEDSREEFSYPNSGQQQESEEGRSSQQSNHDAYYRQWHYATPAPSSANRRIGSANNQKNRKLQPIPSVNQQNRDPYDMYMDDYDYVPPHSAPNSHQMQQYHNTASPSQDLQKPEQQGQVMNLLSIIKTLKTMWDLYQSFASSWNTMAQRHNNEEELAKQKYKQQIQLRNNTAKQKQQQQQQKQKLNNNKKPAQRTTKNPKKHTTTTTPATTTTTTTTTFSSSELDTSSEEEEALIEQNAKVEPRKGSKGDKTTAKDISGLRDKRQTSSNTEVATAADDVGEGRYIKGDPLKGYYDFVITEGSYKFWAVFQVGTALLIIYSTFAAIYYSKVNPLVSDYDYTDYLGGGRSLSGGDLDFVDDETAGSERYTAQPKSWSDWLPRTGHSLKFILDAIDKLPTDHHDDNEATQTDENVNRNNVKEENKAM